MMKKVVPFALGVFLLAGCQTPNTSTNLPEPEIDMSNFYAQVCETKDGPCVNMACSLQDATYKCAEKVSDISGACSETKQFDDILDSYQICGENFENVSIFNYAQNLETLNYGTPAELEAKIAEEVQTVEDGGSSSFLGPFMASMGGALVGGMIANALFGQNNALPPKQPASAYEQPYDKKMMDNDKAGVSQNNEKVKQSATQTKEKAKAKAAAAKKTQSQSTQQKTNASSPKKSSGRRR